MPGVGLQAVLGVVGSLPQGDRVPQTFPEVSKERRKIVHAAGQALPLWVQEIVDLRSSLPLLVFNRRTEHERPTLNLRHVPNRGNRLQELPARHFPHLLLAEVHEAGWPGSVGKFLQNYLSAFLGVRVVRNKVSDNDCC